MPADLLRAVESLRLAESRLTRRREADRGPNESDRLALIYILDRADAGSPVTPGELGAHIGITTGATSSLIRRLAAAHLIEVQPYPGDLRRRLLVPGSRRPPSELDPASAAIRRLVTGLSAEERAVTTEFIAQVAQLLDETDRA